MRRRLPSCLAVVVLLTGCGGSTSEGPAADPAGGDRAAAVRRPPRVEDVLLITIDTLRADALGYAGRDDVATPTIDRLAASGVVFTNAQAHNVVTLPSHANILTGLLPYEHGVRDNTGFTLPESIGSAATYFSRAGFATAAVVGASVLASRFGLAKDFDLYDESFTRAWGEQGRLPERPGSEVVERGLAWWRANAERRRFLWLHLYDVHAPYEPPEPFASTYARDPYLGEVAATDAYLTPLLEPFLAGGERPALIVFTADHGEALGDHGELTHGFFAYQETLQVPLVLWAPGLEPGTDDRLARHVDLLPTMLEAAEVEGPESPISGRSLFSDPVPGETISYLEAVSANLNRGWAPLRGVIHDGYKFISVPIPELYDLEADPAETENLVQTERRIYAELRDLLPEEETWPPRHQEDVTAEVRNLLLGLGYLAGETEYKTTFTAEEDPKNMIGLDRKLHEAIDLLNRGRLDEAARRVREVLELRPMETAFTLLAEIQTRQGRFGEAVEVLERAVATGFAPPSTVQQLARTLLHVGRADEALELLQPFRDSDDTGGLNALAGVLIEVGRLEDAHRILQRSLALQPENPITHETVALLALRAGQWEETRRAALRALEIDDGLSLAWNYLGGALYNLGRPGEAVDAWESSVDNDPQNWDAMFNMAIVAREIGDLTRAERALRLFVASAPPARYSEDLGRARQWLAQIGGV